MSWLEAVPAALVAVVWCVAPGVVWLRVLGWHGIACWGGAPVVSVALVAVTAVVSGRLGVPWGPLPVVAATVLGAVVLFGIRAAMRQRPRSSGGPAAPSRYVAFLRGGSDGPWSRPALLAGLVVTVALGWLTVVLAFGRVDAISPTYDAVHHYSAVAHILTTGDGSSLTLGELTSPGRPTGYPAAWHDLVALVVLTSGASIPAASNLMAFAAAAVVWPLGCALLTRQVAGPRAGVLLVAPVLATAFTAMPWLVMTWGVLWPNLLGLALVPAALAAVVAFVMPADDSALSRSSALLLGAVAAPGLSLAHPNAVISLLVLGLSPVAVAAIVSAVRAARAGKRLRTVAGPVGAVALAAGVLWLLAWSPFLASVRAFDWPASMGARDAVLGVLWNGTNGRPPLYVVSVLVLVGGVFALRHARTAWLVPAHLTSAFLYVLAIAREGDVVTALTGAWYNDSYRLAAMVPITGVPLAAIGVTGTVSGLVGVWARRASRPSGSPNMVTVTAAAVTLTAAVLVVASDGFRVGVHAFVVAGTYQREATWMLQPGQRDFLEAAGRAVPAGEVVAANPWTGNALVYPLTGRETMFPHMSGNWTPEQKLIQERLRDAAVDPSVCRAVRATDLKYAIDGPVSYWPWDRRSQSFPGLTDLDRAPGFEPVLSGGGSTLYRITACGAGPARSTG